MNRDNEIKQEINQAVSKGLIPVAFFNSVVKDTKCSKFKSSNLKMNRRYRQTIIPRGYSNLTVSKVYELSQLTSK